MKWEKPVLNDMNGMDSASANCGNGSGNQALGGCTNGFQNAGWKIKPGHFDGACATGTQNLAG